MPIVQHHRMLPDTSEPSQRRPERGPSGTARGLGLLALVWACGRDVTYATVSDRSPAPRNDTPAAREAERTDGAGSAGAGEPAAGSDDADLPSGAGVEGAELEGAELEGATLAPGLLHEPPAAGDMGATDLGSDTPDAGGANVVGDNCWLGDAPAPAAADAEPLSGELHCLLMVEWSEITTSGPPGCTAFSSALEARWFDWQGGALASFDPAATPFASVGTRLERMRRCARDVAGGVEVWRFEEFFELAAPLPSGQCPTQAFGARYHYTEHGKLPGPGVVFGADQAEACEYEACVRFVPSPLAQAQAPEPSETRCAAPSLLDEPSHAAAIGERCRLSYECEAGSFCSLERDDGSCGFPGEEICQRAPRLDECSSELEPVCPCYRAELADSNRCEQNARGVSVGRCP
jgi:hypothetical protein